MRVKQLEALSVKDRTRVQFGIEGRQLFVVVAVIGILLLRLSLLSMYPLMDKTESRYAEIPREMLSLGDWVTPRLDPDEPFLGKPPLAFWSTIPSYAVFGVNEFSARLPSFIFALATLLTVYLLGRILFKPATVLLASLILTSSALFYVLAGFVSTDSALGFCTTAALSGFACSVFARNDVQRKIGVYSFFIWLGFSLLAKGLVGPVIILAPVLLWSLLTSNWNWRAPKTELSLGIGLMLLITLPWHLMAEGRTPGFLYYYFVGEHLERFLVSGWSGNLYGKSHSAPYGTIWVYLSLALCPWLLPVLWRLREERLWALAKHCCKDQRLLFLLLWFITPPAFFTFSGNILMPYIYPSMPAFALLAAWYLERSDNGALFPNEDRFTFSIPRFESCFEYGNRWTFRTCCVATPLVLLVAAVFVLPAVAQRRSQKELISAYQEANYLLPGKLVYLSSKPYSADFYLGSTALDLSLEQSALNERSSGKSSDYYVTTKEDYERFERKIPHLRRLATFGNYVLSKEQLSFDSHAGSES